MDDVTRRLLACFVAVFPEVPEKDLLHAELGSTPAWDSIATATLVSLVEQEFGVAIPADDLETLHSFEAFRCQVQR